MKRIWMIMLLAFSLFTLASCKNKTEDFRFAFSYMYTFIAVDIKRGPADLKEEIGENLDAIFKMYHELGTYADPLPADSKYYENIYSINRKQLQKLEIDEPLYQMLKLSEEYRELTDGLFDISIGAIVDVWKNNILDDYEGYLFEEIPEEVFSDVINTVDSMEVYEDPFTLTHEGDRYYVRINYEDVKLDLGAIAKGYATQVAADYIESLGLIYYSITAGSSSIVVGKNPDRKGEIYIVSLENPLRTGFDDRSYGKVNIKDTSITTSGNFEQYAEFQGLRYHHIISPETKRPMHYYHTVTLIGKNAGLLDAISTAMLSMNPSVFDAWMAKHQNHLDIEAIRYDYDGTIKTYLKTTEFIRNN